MRREDGGRVMGIYIRGMQMPKEGYGNIIIYPGGMILCGDGYGLNPGTKAIPIPPYVRMLDADAHLPRQHIWV